MLYSSDEVAISISNHTFCESTSNIGILEWEQNEPATAAATVAAIEIQFHSL